VKDYTEITQPDKEKTSPLNWTLLQSLQHEWLVSGLSLTQST